MIRRRHVSVKSSFAIRAYVEGEEDAKKWEAPRDLAGCVRGPGVNLSDA
jgi:hypothetical protein